jgi:lipoyl(octanoyl) transferase
MEEGEARGRDHGKRWRLLVDEALPGAMNMAVDEALLESAIGGGEPALRFYTWRPAALSVGVNQSLGEVDPAACSRLGFEVVRRLTGGRAVLHQHELTYSIAARATDPLVSGGVLESYRKISAALVAGLRLLGARVELTPPDRALHTSLAPARRESELGASADGPGEDSHGAICFDAASDYELTAGGRKLVGSAQARRGGALLQHGSILLDIDWEAWASVFAFRTEAGRLRALRNLPSRMTSLGEELGRHVTEREVREALQAGFSTAFEIDLEPGTATQTELALASRLATEKYAGSEWTGRGQGFVVGVR